MAEHDAASPFLASLRARCVEANLPLGGTWWPAVFVPAIIAAAIIAYVSSLVLRPPDVAHPVNACISLCLGAPLLVGCLLVGLFHVRPSVVGSDAGLIVKWPARSPSIVGWDRVLGLVVRRSGVPGVPGRLVVATSTGTIRTFSTPAAEDLASRCRGADLPSAQG